MAVKKVDDFPLLHLCLKYSNLLLALLAFHYCTIFVTKRQNTLCNALQPGMQNPISIS